MNLKDDLLNLLEKHGYRTAGLYGLRIECDVESLPIIVCDYTHVEDM